MGMDIGWVQVGECFFWYWPTRVRVRVRVHVRVRVRVCYVDAVTSAT